MKIIRKLAWMVAGTTTLSLGTLAASASATAPATYCIKTMWNGAQAITNNDIATEALVLQAYKAGVASAADNFTPSHALTTKYKAVVAQELKEARSFANTATECGVSTQIYSR